MSDQVKLTPMAGGKNDISGICSILEIGSFTLLLDCGCSTKNSVDLLQKIKKHLSNVGKSIDAVILSHADLQHMGALPTVFNKKMGGLLNTNVVCTLPVHKFGQLILYDYCSNSEMESAISINNNDITTNNPNNIINNKKNNANYDYGDIDLCFHNPTVVKFSQMIEIKSSSSSSFSVSNSTTSPSTLSLCAYPSGRTIGGAIWRIRHGSTEILYAVDFNMKNEIVLNGANIDDLPCAPSLLIMDACTSSQLTSVKTKIENKQLLQQQQQQNKSLVTFKSKKKKDNTKDDPTSLINIVLDTLRNNGNVLIPCETAGRSLELIQILANHWMANKIGLYHLIFLSPMSNNVLEFAKSQLEWMSDNLSKKFYNGGRNPFELPCLHCCTSIRTMEKLYSGPKVVLTTDASMNCGLSKELVLLWGGDPRCSVIFTDMSSDQESLAYELRSQLPPIVISVTKPIRVELVGEELAAFRNKEEKLRKEEEDVVNRKKREDELEELALAGGDEEEEEDDNGDKTDESEALSNNNGNNNDVNDSEQQAQAVTTTATTPQLKRQLSDSSGINNNNNTALKKRKLQLMHSNLLARFATPCFPMFETRDTQWVVDDFGASNDDLVFKDVIDSLSAGKYGMLRTKTAAVAKGATIEKGSMNKSGTNTTTTTTNGNGKSNAITTGADIQSSLLNSTNINATATATTFVDIPTKIISTTVKVQLTCAVTEIPIAGRADMKVAKFLISKITPVRMVVLRGSSYDCESLVNHARSAQIQAISPMNGESLSFVIAVDRIKLQIPLSLFPSIHNMRSVQGLNSSMKETMCTLATLTGSVIEVVTKDQSGLRTLRLQPITVTPILHAAAAISNIQPMKLKSVKKMKKVKTTPANNIIETSLNEISTQDNPSETTVALVKVHSDENEIQNVLIKNEPINESTSSQSVGIVASTEESKLIDITLVDTTTKTITTPVIEPAAVLDMVAEPTSSSSSTAASVPVDLSSLDVDAFFNSMVGELMVMDSNGITAGSSSSEVTNTSNNSTNTNTTVENNIINDVMICKDDNPTHITPVVEVVTPALPVFTFSYPDVYGDYDDIISNSSSSNSSSSNSSSSSSSIISEKKSSSLEVIEDDEIEEEEEEEEEEIDDDDKRSTSNVFDTMIHQGNIGVSVGEITLNSIKLLLEKVSNYSVEFKISATTGAALVCDGQVIIRRNDTSSSSSTSNNFIAEGPPVKSFWEAKKILNEKFAFI